MSHTQHTIAGAIERSRSHNEIVSVIVDDIEAAFAELTAGLDTDYDYVDTRGQDGESMREVWDCESGAGNGEMDWRVHLLQRNDQHRADAYDADSL
jgi:hypothetical protein